MKELFLKCIWRVYIDERSQYVVFIDFLGESYWVYKAEGDCCSSSWFESINFLENLLGNKVIGIEIKKAIEDEKSKEGDVTTIYGYTIKTDKGYTDIEFRNNSNGYYGGWCEFVPGAKLIFPEIEDTLKPDNFTYENWNALVKEKKYLSNKRILLKKLPLTMTIGDSTDGDSTEVIKLYPYGQIKDKLNK